MDLKSFATMTSSLAFAAAAQGQTNLPAPDAPEGKVCVVQMNSYKDVVAANILDAKGNRVYSAPLMRGPETLRQAAATNTATGQDAGILEVTIKPANPADNAQSRLPQSCKVDGKTFPVEIPPVIKDRLFKPGATLG